MKKYIADKLIYSLVSLWLVVTLTFILIQLIPGDPFTQEQVLPEEIRQSLRNYYGLNDSILTQYLRYLYQIATLDLGPSLVYKGSSVGQLIARSFPTSALLGMEALIIALPLGIVIGILSTVYKNKWKDTFLSLFLVIGISVPSFMIATLLQYIFAIKYPILPIARWGTFSQTILPALSLSFLPVAFIARLTRTKLHDELNQNYIITARAKGLPEYIIIFRHALRNIMTPILGYVGPMTAGILTGSFIIEKIFSIPGLGFWFVSSVSNRDYPVIMGITLFYCFLLITASLIVDILTAYIDPRIAAERYGKKDV